MADKSVEATVSNSTSELGVQIREVSAQLAGMGIKMEQRKHSGDMIMELRITTPDGTTIVSDTAGLSAVGKATDGAPVSINNFRLQQALELAAEEALQTDPGSNKVTFTPDEAKRIGDLAANVTREAIEQRRRGGI